MSPLCSWMTCTSITKALHTAEKDSVSESPHPLPHCHSTGCFSTVVVFLLPASDGNQMVIKSVLAAAATEETSDKNSGESTRRICQCAGISFWGFSKTKLVLGNRQNSVQKLKVILLETNNKNQLEWKDSPFQMVRMMFTNQWTTKQQARCRCNRSDGSSSSEVSPRLGWPTPFIKIGSMKKKRCVTVVGEGKKRPNMQSRPTSYRSLLPPWCPG